jgi:hypothetical protein
MEQFTLDCDSLPPLTQAEADRLYAAAIAGGHEPGVLKREGERPEARCTPLCLWEVFGVTGVSTSRW